MELMKKMMKNQKLYKTKKTINLTFIKRGLMKNKKMQGKINPGGHGLAETALGVQLLNAENAKCA